MLFTNLVRDPFTFKTNLRGGHNSEFPLYLLPIDQQFSVYFPQDHAGH